MASINCTFTRTWSAALCTLPSTTFATPSCFAISRRFARLALILQRGSARNYFQVCDASQSCQDFVLNAVREIGVVLGRGSDFQTEAPRRSSVLGLLRVRLFQTFQPRLLPERPATMISTVVLGFRRTHLLPTCEESTVASPGLVRALASVRGLRPARERKSNGAVDLSRDTSRQIVERSRSIFGFNRRGGRGSVSSSSLIVSYVVPPAKGG